MLNGSNRYEFLKVLINSKNREKALPLIDFFYVYSRLTLEEYKELQIIAYPVIEEIIEEEVEA